MFCFIIDLRAMSTIFEQYLPIVPDRKEKEKESYLLILKLVFAISMVVMQTGGVVHAVHVNI